MADINGGIATTFNVGGELTFTIGGTAYTLVNKEAGTLVQEIGMEELREWWDNGAYQGAIKGDEQPSNISIDSKMAQSGTPASDLHAILLAVTTTGRPLVISPLVIKNPDHPDAATGTSFTYADCHLVPPFNIREGRQFNMYQLRFRSKSGRPAVAAYGS